MTVEISLVATECRRAVQQAKEEGGGVPEMARAAFPLARDHWMVLDEDKQFKGACVAIYEAAAESDKEGIRRELELLRALAAAASGVPVDFGAMLADEGDEPVKGFGLAAIWRESA